MPYDDMATVTTGYPMEKQIEPPETPNSYCCEDREKMATAGSTIPRALAQRGCLGQHKS